MGKSRANKENTAAETANVESPENNSPTNGQDGEANANPLSSGAASLAKVLEEIRDFRKDTKEQLNDIIRRFLTLTKK